MTSRYVDLSHPIEHEMTTYPGLPGPAISTYISREKSAERLVDVPIVVIRASDRAAIGPEVLDDPGALWGKAVLVHTGWSRHW